MCDMGSHFQLTPNTGLYVEAPLLRIMEVTGSVLLYSSSIQTLFLVFLNTGAKWVARATKFCTVVPYICGSHVWNFFHVTILASRIFELVPTCFKCLCNPVLE
jgi:hypothetical protein